MFVAVLQFCHGILTGGFVIWSCDSARRGWTAQASVICNRSGIGPALSEWGRSGGNWGCILKRIPFMVPAVRRLRRYSQTRASAEMHGGVLQAHMVRKLNIGATYRFWTVGLTSISIHCIQVNIIWMQRLGFHSLIARSTHFAASI